jgi:hypothetical protein
MQSPPGAAPPISAVSRTVPAIATIAVIAVWTIAVIAVIGIRPVAVVAIIGITRTDIDVDAGATIPNRPKPSRV